MAILGLGNVALDCARVLLQPVERLQATDIASHALAQLQESGVQQVDLIGRRGPAQASDSLKHQETEQWSWGGAAGHQHTSCLRRRLERKAQSRDVEVQGREGLGMGRGRHALFMLPKSVKESGPGWR